MYSIYLNDNKIYDDSSVSMDNFIISPKLNLKMGTAGTLDMTVPVTNTYYSTIQKMSSTIRVKRDGSEMWRGRVLSEETDFNLNKKMTCEGALAFLNDTIQPQYKYETDIRNFFTDILNNHNDRMSDPMRQIYYGNIEGPSAYIELDVNYESTLDVINNALDIIGGYVNVRIDLDGHAYLDYIKNNYGTCDQEIEFGVNLLDMKRSYDMSEIVTVIIPRGAQDSETGEYVTVESVNDGSIYVEKTGLVSLYGPIEKVVDWSDITNPSTLLQAAEEYLDGLVEEVMTLELSAIDLNYLNADVDHFNLFDKVLCKSTPHNLMSLVPVTAMEIDFANPQNTKISLGKDNRKTKTMTSYIDKKIEDKIETEVPPEVAKVVKLKMPDILDVTTEKVVSADVIMSTFCFSRYMLTEFLETNFDAIDGRKSSHPSTRNYIRVYNNTIQFLEANILDTKVQYTDHAGTPLYWTSIDESSTNRFKYFTYESPLTIAKDKRPGGDITDDEFCDMYRVWVYETETPYVKGEIGFPSNGQTGEPLITLGVGDGTQNGIAHIRKNTEGVFWEYRSLTDHVNRAFKINDDNIYYTLDGITWIKIGGESTAEVVKIIDHVPTVTDLTGQYTVFARYDQNDAESVVVNDAAGKIYTAQDVYVEIPVKSKVTVTPPTANVPQGGTQAFAANIPVLWSVSGGNNGTTINSEGTLTVDGDETAGGTLTVTATSTEWPTDRGTATVTVVLKANLGEMLGYLIKKYYDEPYTAPVSNPEAFDDLIKSKYPDADTVYIYGIWKNGKNQSDRLYFYASDTPKESFTGSDNNVLVGVVGTNGSPPTVGTYIGSPLEPEARYNAIIYEFEYYPNEGITSAATVYYSYKELKDFISGMMASLVTDADAADCYRAIVAFDWPADQTAPPTTALSAVYTGSEESTHRTLYNMASSHTINDWGWVQKLICFRQAASAQEYATDVTNSIGPYIFPEEVTGGTWSPGSTITIYIHSVVDTVSPPKSTASSQ